MKNVRFGIVGLGNMGKFHADYLLKEKVARALLVAVNDSHDYNTNKYPQLKVFPDASSMICSGEIDALLIATPHFSHTSIGMEAMRAGLHVLVEKPISVHKADCERLIGVQKETGKVFGAMFQLRTEPKYRKIKKLITEGELGKITRVSWIVTDWYRTEAYYSSGGWRATWRGEGGGVLLNQCPHNLDLLQWFCGRPSQVRGFCQLGRYHDIEVEDNVTGYLEFPNGATGVFITSTGEAPGTNRLEIVGERGKVVLESGKLSFTRNEVSMLDFSKSAKAGFAKPEVWQVEIPFENNTGMHHEITQNFVDAILDGVPMIAPGEEGLHSVELANALLYSSLTGQTVALPLDGAVYEQKLNELMAGSRFQKKVVRPAAGGDDFAKSFSR